jgi:hypothetical protein
MISFIFFILSSSLCLSSSKLTEIYYNEKNLNKNRIIDYIHENTKEINTYISDILILFQIIYSMSCFSLEIIEKCLFILSIIQFLRILCFTTTILPPLKKDKIRVFGMNGNGSEYIFSGHACYSCITFLYLFLEYKEKINIYFLIIYNIISQSCIIISRNHYTVDVILAWIITTSFTFNVEMYLFLYSS